MNRFFQFFAFIALLAPTAVSARFVDIHEGDKYYDAVTYTEEKGIVKGYEDRTFKPYQTLNRAEFAKIIVEMWWNRIPEQQRALMGVSRCSAGDLQTFPDVPSDSWFAYYVCEAKDLGIIKGYPDGTFKPANTVTFVEAAKMIAVAFDLETAESIPWYKTYIEALRDGSAIPISIHLLDQEIMRHEMVEMVYRLDAGIRTKDSRVYSELADPWTTYSNDLYGFSFEYPSYWHDLYFEVNKNPGTDHAWQVHFGPICKGCAEGSDTYAFYVKGYKTGSLDPAGLYTNEWTNVVNDTTSGDVRTIIYTDGGICGYRSAMILGTKADYILSGFCIEDSKTQIALFQKILETFRVYGDAPVQDDQAVNDDGVNYSNHFFEYSLRHYFEAGSASVHGEYDAQLIRRDRATNKEEVLIVSIKEVLPELQETHNRTLVHFATPAGANIVIFKSALMDTDNASGDLYTYDIDARNLQKMNINAIYDGFYGGFAMASDQNKFIWAPNTSQDGNAKLLYYIDLIHDRYHVIDELTGNETFNAGGFALSSDFDVKWTGDKKTTIRYGVFDQTTKTSWGTDATLIEHREKVVAEEMAENRATVFDACNTISSYKFRPWYPRLEHTASKMNLTLDNEAISEGCYSDQGQMFIFIKPGAYCEGSSVYRFNTQTHALELASLGEHAKAWGCHYFKEFGKRTGNIIPLTGTFGDAGCLVDMYFDYDFIKNTAELIKTYSQCEGDDEGTWTYY